mgnify:CR=1 FL=1
MTLERTYEVPAPKNPEAERIAWGIPAMRLPTGDVVLTTYRHSAYRIVDASILDAPSPAWTWGNIHPTAVARALDTGLVAIGYTDGQRARIELIAPPRR